MTWEELELGWQIAFNKAWEAFCLNTIPIGAAIINENNEIVSVGQNMIFVEKANAPVIYGSSLAHAEINAIVQLKRKEHPNIRSYTLYSTTEPCILCFGAIVMGNIRHCKFAARDRYAGATKYSEHSEYVKSKKIKVEGPHEKLEAVQVALATYYELDKKFPNHERIISQMALDCPEGVAAGRGLFNDTKLRQLVEENRSASDAFTVICNRLKMINDEFFCPHPLDIGKP